MYIEDAQDTPTDVILCSVMLLLVWSVMVWFGLQLALLSKLRTWPGRGCVVNMAATTLRPQYNLFNAIWRSWGEHMTRAIDIFVTF